MTLPITADTFRADIEVVEHCDCANLTLWLVLILAIKAFNSHSWWIPCLADKTTLHTRPE
ncbi:hypothetical protein OS493_015459 [Desmophyllum pertusum]|uniref:Uncharacterized protein n=1 Tax=Desmophyllum pertusum TaxID=174260 RepID=A0A9X0CTK9_9CNID|nr:hypothetical protein OS493_015459 [Desmophyllum pertusum]